MSYNVKITILVTILVAISASVMYLYFYLERDTFDLIREAEELYASGDLYGAHGKAEEALRSDPLNRRAINLKGSLFLEVQNDTNYRSALEEYQLGITAMNRQNFHEASKSFNKAIEHIDNISRAAPQYESAQILYKEILVKYDELNDRFTVYYYNVALTAYKKEDFAEAFEYLRQAPKETVQVAELRNDIAYNLGMRRYEEIMTTSSPLPLSFYNDAFYWLRQVSPSSSKYKQAQDAIKTLTGKQPVNRP